MQGGSGAKIRPQSKYCRLQGHRVSLRRGDMTARLTRLSNCRTLRYVCSKLLQTWFMWCPVGSLSFHLGFFKERDLIDLVWHCACFLLHQYIVGSSKALGHPGDCHAEDSETSITGPSCAALRATDWSEKCYGKSVLFIPSVKIRIVCVHFKVCSCPTVL